jgi:hypothetical protein
VRVEQQGLGIAFGLVRERFDATGAAGAKSLGQTRSKQRVGQRLDPFGNRPSTDGASTIVKGFVSVMCR